MLLATQTVVRASLVGAGALLLFSVSAPSPAAAPNPAAPIEANGPPPANPRDLSGKWLRATPFQSYGAVKGGANEFAAEMIRAYVEKRKPDLSPEKASIKGLHYNEPVFTPAGRAAFERNFPGYGQRMSSDHRNDPTASCDPMGVPRMMIAHAVGGMESWEIVQEKDRMLWLAKYHHEYRMVWTDGRKLPPLDDQLYPTWNGFSVGHWEGNTFIVNSIGFNEKTWLDHNGFPHTANMKLEERYRLLDANTLEQKMTVTDPEYYVRPFESEVKIWKRDTVNNKEWDQQLNCAPSDENKFNRLIRDGKVNEEGP